MYRIISSANKNTLTDFVIYPWEHSHIETSGWGVGWKRCKGHGQEEGWKRELGLECKTKLTHEINF